ncbi:MAG: hypothetical protein HN686_09515 [Bacteroidetes bacterium]|nr:hypothetical protein [Bacteroidota bacterium]
MNKAKLHSIILTIAILLLSVSLFAQSDKQSYAKNFQETIWLSSDRHFYLSGESVYFQALLLEKDSYQHSVLSMAARIELLDESGKKVFKSNFELQNSRVKSSFSLPSDLATGWYYLRAYTNWMRNFQVNEFAIQAIKVVNPGDDDLNTIYKEEIQNKHSASPIPDSLQKYTINVSEDRDNPNQVNVQVKGLKNYGITSFRLLVHQSYTWFWFEEKNSLNGFLLFQIPKNKLPGGIMQFTLLNNKNEIIKRKLWSSYTPESNRPAISLTDSVLNLRSQHEAIYSLDDLNIKGNQNQLYTLITTDEPYDPNDSSIPGLAGWSASSNIPSDYKSFQHWLQINHYPDTIVKAFFLPDSTRPQNIQANGTSQNPDMAGIRYYPETRAGIMGGRVIDTNTSEGVSSVSIAMSVLNDNSFYTTITDISGFFFFAFPDVRSPLDYILNFTTQPKQNWEIDIFSEYDDRIDHQHKESFSLDSVELVFLRELKINYQINSVFKTAKVEKGSLPDTFVNKALFFYPPDYSIHVGDYIKLANVREVIYEVVPNVIVRNKNEKQVISMYLKDPVSRAYETLVLLDGIPITQHKDLLQLPPDRIHSIEVKNSIFIHGKNIFSAIVSIRSKNGDYAGLDLPQTAILSSIDLPEKSKTANLPDTPPANSNIPNLNQTLLWETLPDQANGSIQFQTTDLANRLIISIMGFNKKGEWQYNKRTIEIKN